MLSCTSARGPSARAVGIASTIAATHRQAVGFIGGPSTRSRGRRPALGKFTADSACAGSGSVLCCRPVSRDFAMPAKKPARTKALKPVEQAPNVTKLLGDLRTIIDNGRGAVAQ